MLILCINIINIKIEKKCTSDFSDSRKLLQDKVIIEVDESLF